jgi:steroid 5-alpha reductase family enzyme
MPMKLSLAINAHKGSTFAVVLMLMWYFNNYTLGPWIYLALHGSYGLLWIFKDRTYPDKQWEKTVSIHYGALVFVSLALYWIPAYLVASFTELPPPWVLSLAVAMNAVGLVLHFGSDAQKHYTLLYREGLITEGFFARSRNTNYLGEAMIYLSFAIVSYNPLGFTGIAAFLAGVFIPNMIRKDKSLSRYPEFSAYKKRAGFFFPSLFRD